MKLPVINLEYKKIKEINLPDTFFSYPRKEHLVWEEIRSYLSRKRRGTACTKTRGEVSGSGKKPWRQKKTGRARVGSIRSPLWRKGGTVFGPKPRDYSYWLPKKARRNAIKSVLSDKKQNNKLLIIENLELKSPKTKEALETIKKLKIENGLFVDEKDNKNLILAMRNLPDFKAIYTNNINLFDILRYEWIVISERALNRLIGVYQ
ncbi:MAG: 50S ribosomal protein L4 [Acidobacteriota bacterium]